MTTTISSWQPSASLSAIKQRAVLYRSIRQFFAERQVLEVDTPILGMAATVDPAIDSLLTMVMGDTRYLQTSPEFFLKRLLAAGSGDIYSLAKVFRQGEKGRRHHPEFTLLEWYRVAWDEQQLIDEVIDLIRLFLPDVAVTRLSYRDIFLHVLSVDPHLASVDSLKEIAKTRIDIALDTDDKDIWLDLLMSHCVEPSLPEQLVIIDNYPASQAALAKVEQDASGQLVARRFEVYLHKMELANGYFELTDEFEQKQRFEQDQSNRRQRQLPVYPYDTKVVQALASGLPSCAGVALGIDRLLMVLCGVTTIAEVLSFAE
jgi:lysyl-tRNA synthetase class 2